MLDSIYYMMILKLIKNHIFGVKRQYFTIFYAMLYWTSLCSVTKSVQFYCMGLYHSGHDVMC